ncbi:MAG: asparagine synthase (glutamine-hydrolyzing) [Desulfovibrionaceae bacterium]|nr:asparagine synthase (glutamine-hydrolyzing) [Desulfovibrionaceae bacterium]
MCGIAGYKMREPRPDAVLEAMVEALRHRGPDSAGYLLRPGLRAGMRRLSINDVEGGDQPLYNEDGGVALLYNGEIYNSPALRAELERAGHRFRTRSDGEVICHLWEEEGEALFDRLDGMFAAALWIEAEQKLVLARDIPGEKPLYYARLSDTDLAFASEISSLRRLDVLDQGLDLQALWDYPTFLWVPEPATALRSVRALPRGHLLVADASGVRVRPYAGPHPLPDPALPPLSDAEAVARAREVVTRAVESRLLSDVPLGAFLSGGLDSSIVATLAARRVPDLSTFTIGFEDVADPYHGHADESPQAEALARKLGTKHHTIRVTAQDFRAALRDFCRHGDQPFSVSSGLGILAVCGAAREAGIKVLLTGDGADECFGGYSWYAHLDRLGPAPRSGPERPEISFQNTGMSEDERLAAMSAYSLPARLWAWHYYASEPEKALLFHPDVTAGARGSLRLLPQGPAGGTPRETIAQDRDFYFPFEMLRKADRMSMARSVEARVPFAAPEVLALSARLSYPQMVRGGELKWALRRAFEDVLPPEVVSRPKHGFNVPIDHWLRGQWADLVDEALGPGARLAREGLVRKDAADAARALLRRPGRLNGHTVFSFITLNIWLEEADAWKS